MKNKSTKHQKKPQTIKEWMNYAEEQTWKALGFKPPRKAK